MYYNCIKHLRGKLRQLTRSMWEGKNMKNIKTLIQEIENIELALTVFNSKRALSNVQKNMEVKQIGGCQLLIEPSAPKSIYYNRIKGFSEKDIDKLEDILDEYEKVNAVPAFDLNSLNMSRELMQALISEDYCYSDQLVFMVLEDLKTYPVANGLEIITVTEESAELFLNLVLKSNPAMAIDPKVIEEKKVYFYNENFKNYIVKVDGNIAAMGSLFIDGDTGYIANDYTFPDYRGKGCQSKLLEYRINTAKELNLSKIVTDVEFGTQSQQNMEKYGFRMVYLSAYWTKMD